MYIAIKTKLFNLYNEPLVLFESNKNQIKTKDKDALNTI
jgi:hypothetical protein